MKIPQLKKKSEIKTCHNVSWEDNYSWIHQKNILEVLKDSYPMEWLLPLEMYELIHNLKINLRDEIYNYLMQLKQNEGYAYLLDNGLKLIAKNN